MRAVRGTARAAGFAVLGLTLAVAFAHAATLDHEQARGALNKRDDAAARRQGAEDLGETGDMGDVAALVQALRDADADVRTAAEQSLWRIWSRSGDPDADKALVKGVDEIQ